MRYGEGDRKAEILKSYQFAKERSTSKRAFASVLDQFGLPLTALPHCFAAKQLAELQSIAPLVGEVRMATGRAILRQGLLKHEIKPESILSLLAHGGEKSEVWGADINN